MKNENILNDLELENIKKSLYIPHFKKDNIVVCSYFGSWCLIVLNSNFEITSKYWSEKEKILKCFLNFEKHNKLNLDILGIKKSNKNVIYTFCINRDIRNCWFDGDFR